MSVRRGSEGARRSISDLADLLLCKIAGCAKDWWGGVSKGRGSGVKGLPIMTVLSLSSCCIETIEGMVPESEWRCWGDMVAREYE
jgi:hypothetical protein